MTALARLQFDGVEVLVDLARPRSVALEQHFDTRQPRHFEAPPAISLPLRVGTFTGEVNNGASCNCRQITLVPHCSGTHTEGVGHLTSETHDVLTVIPTRLLPALLVSITPVATKQTREDTIPLPEPEDLLITREAISAAWPRDLAWQPVALLIRTLPNGPDKLSRDYSREPAPYLTRQAVNDLVIRGIQHLVLDLPSLDRSHDDGRLTGHRLYFGMPGTSRSLADARRASCTITELAWFAPDIEDGPYALQLQAPSFGGDAVPSRPLLYPLQSA